MTDDADIAVGFDEGRPLASPSDRSLVTGRHVLAQSSCLHTRPRASVEQSA